MVGGASLVLVAPIAAVPLFLSSVGTASVAVQAGDRCAPDTGATYTGPVPRDELEDLDADPLQPLTEAGTLGRSTQWMTTDGFRLTGPDPMEGTQTAVLVREGVEDHIEVVDGPPGPITGAWLTDRAAADIGVDVGDTASIGDVPVEVGGIYRDLAGLSVDDYWCAHADLLLVDGIDRILPPPVILTDRATYARLMVAVGIDPVGVTWEAPLRDDQVSVTDARHLVDDLACDSPLWPRLDWCADGLPSLPDGLPNPYALPGDDNTSPFENTRIRDEFVRSYFDSHLPFVIDRSGSITTSVGGGVWPVAGCAALAGVGFVAAAGALWTDRRRREVTLLTVRGVSPAALGLKAVLELLVPLTVGAVGGVAVAYGLVRWLGPSPTIESSAVVRAAVSGAVGLAAAMATVGVIVARRARGPSAERAGARSFRWLRFVPWELALGAVTVVSYQRLGDWGVPVSNGAEISRVDPLGLMFPVLFLLTAVAVAARLLLLGIGPLRRVSRRWPTSLFLAVRRVSRYRVAVIALVAASAVAAGVLGYAATINRSLEATLDVKARVFVGSDAAVSLDSDRQLPAELVPDATPVDAYRRSWIDARADGERLEVTVIALDPATFEHATFWDDSFSSVGVGEILRRLDEPPAPGPDGSGGSDSSGGEDGGAIPAVVTGISGLPDTVETGIKGVRTTRFTIHEVADVDGFPGMKRPTPTVFVAAHNLDGFDLSGARAETWIKGDHDAILAVLDAADTRYVEARRAADVVDRVAFLTVAWTFDFVQAIALAAGLLVLGGLAAYLDARRRSRLLGYAFARRMGLSSGQHRLALLAELTASVVVGCWLGLAIALTAAWLAYDRIDPVPGFRPGPVVRPATALILALAAVAAVVAVVAAAIAQRRADRDSPVEVLRAGT
jgi:putative ABC transport system permease protein